MENNQESEKKTLDESAPQKNGAKKWGKYNPETVEVIVNALRNLSSRKVAFTLAGVGSSTFYEWLADYPEFKAAVDKAESEAAFEATKTLKQFSASDWRCAAWILERKDPSWQKIQKIDHTTNGETISFTLDFGRTLNEEEDVEP